MFLFLQDVPRSCARVSFFDRCILISSVPHLLLWQVTGKKHHAPSQEKNPRNDPVDAKKTVREARTEENDPELRDDMDVGLERKETKPRWTIPLMYVEDGCLRMCVGGCCMVSDVFVLLLFFFWGGVIS